MRSTTRPDQDRNAHHASPLGATRFRVPLQVTHLTDPKESRFARSHKACSKVECWRGSDEEPKR
ncbi:MAG: hypothetical protein ACE5F1_13800 [Planctomycetota bacterium]